ncbi:MAG TPA: hypothetical protein VIB79_13445 [Candidatus Binatia bacterium]|jgi:hypothetical protein
MPSKKSHLLIQNAALVIFGLFVAVVFLEIVPRFLPRRVLPNPLRYALEEMESRQHSTDPYLPDPKLWYVIKPGTDIVLKHPDSDYRMKTNLNFSTAGFRGGTRGGPVWGVAVGDSFTFGLGVNHESTWVAELSRLSQREIVNLGVPGWGPSQYTGTLEEYGLRLKPKLVLYGLFSNDVGNVTRFESDRGHFNEFSLRQFFRFNSMTFNLFRRLRRGKAVVNDIRLDAPAITFSSRELKSRLAADRRRFPTGWPLTEQQIETAHRDSERSQSRFVLLYFPSKEEVYWEAIKEKDSSLQRFDDAIDPLRRSALSLCKSEALSCIDLTPALKRRARKGEDIYFTIDSHWSIAGNRAVAEEIYNELVQRKLL